MKRILVAAMMCSIAVLAGPAHAQEKKGENKVLAIVNGHKITTKEVALASEDIYLSLQEIPPKLRYGFIIQYLIERRLLAQQAIREGLGNSSEYKTRLVFYQAKALRDAYFVEKLKSSVTEDKVRAAYNKEAKKIKGEDRYRAHHILVATEAEAKSIAEKLKKGETFDALAKQFSLDGSKDYGGDLGYFTASEMVKEFSDALKSLKKGELSPPVKTEFGWHIIRMDDKKVGGPRPYEEIKTPIKAVLVRKAVQDKIAELRKTADIKMIDPDLIRMVKDTQEKAKEMLELAKDKPTSTGKSDPASN